MPLSDYLKNLGQQTGQVPMLTPSVTILVFDEQDRVLLVRHPDNELWRTPGGSIDPFETPSDAAVREMWEETGLYVEPARIVGAYGGDETFYYQNSNGDELIYVMIAFEATIIGEESNTQQPSRLELRYFNQAEIEPLDTEPWVKMILRDACRNRRGSNFSRPTWSPPSTGN